MEKLLLRRMMQSFSMIGCAIMIIFSIVVYQVKIQDTKDKLDDMLAQTMTLYRQMQSNYEEQRLKNEENYLRRAEAIAFFLEYNENFQNNEGLEKLKEMMDVTSIQIVNKEGVIAYSSHPYAVGLNLLKHEQAQPFWNFITGDTNKKYVIQYNGVRILDAKKQSFIGVHTNMLEGAMLQIGIDETVFQDFSDNEMIAQVLQQIPTSYHEAIIAINGKTGEIEGITKNNVQEFVLNEKSDKEALSYLQGISDGTMTTINGELQILSVEKLVDGTILCAIYKTSNVFIDYLYFLICMLVGMIILLVIQYIILHKILKKYILDDFKKLEKDVVSLMLGNYDVTFEIQNDTELQSFSKILTKWKNSYRYKELRMNRIIGALDMHVAIFECLPSIHNNFFSENLITILGIDDQVVNEIKDSCEAFESYITQLQEAADENQLIYMNGKYVTIRSFKTDQEFYGVIVDRTEDMIVANSIRTELLETKQLVYQDTLTRLLNRNGFETYVNKYYQNHEHTGVLCIFDLDNFKRVNDEMGHPEGDRLLQEFATALQSYFSVDSYLARLGGDEFVLFIKKHVSISELHTLLNNFMIYIRSQMHYYTKRFQVSTSIGAMIVNQDVHGYEDMYKLADVALYIAKQKGKDAYYVNTNYIRCMKEQCASCDESCDRRKVLQGVLEP